MVPLFVKVGVLKVIELPDAVTPRATETVFDVPDVTESVVVAVVSALMETLV